jgi:hypothetical protein
MDPTMILIKLEMEKVQNNSFKTMCFIAVKSFKLVYIQQLSNLQHKNNIQSCLSPLASSSGAMLKHNITELSFFWALLRNLAFVDGALGCSTVKLT